MATQKQETKAPTLELEQAQKSLANVIAQLNAIVLERSELINLIYAAFVAKLNIFIGGDPGEGKTFLLRLVARASGVKSGYQLFAADTSTDELVGPVDLPKLIDEKRFERNIDGGLFDSVIFVGDEFGRGNSAVTNTQLAILNEREYKQGNSIKKAPLELYAGLSNTLVQGHENDALWDRFTFRYWVKKVSRRSLKKLMKRAAGLEKTPKLTATLSRAELDVLQAQVDNVPVNAGVIDAVLDVVDAAHDSDPTIAASTRKHVLIIKALRAFALVRGDDKVTEDHLGVLQHILWDADPAQANVVAGKVNTVLNSFVEELQASVAKGKTLRDEGVRLIDEAPASEKGEAIGKAYPKLVEINKLRERAKAQMGTESAVRYQAAHDAYETLDGYWQQLNQAITRWTGS